jgi:probable phosphoglycerate mutase
MSEKIFNYFDHYESVVLRGRSMRTDSDSPTQSRAADAISKWPSHLVIVRHAESERNIWKEIATAKGELVYGGEVRDMDVPLTPDGERQAVATGEGLVVEHKFDRVFVSPFKRTMETARLMIEQFPHPVDVTEDERLREIDFGVLDGLTKHGIAHFHPEEKERRAKLGKYHHRPPAGENYPDVALRLHSFLGTLTREAAGESVLVVCHGVVLLIFRKLLERLSEQQVLTIDRDKAQEVRNCSVTHYEFDPNAGTNGKLILRDFNRVYYSEQSKPKPTSESERRYEKLSEEQKEVVLDDLRAWMEQGLMQPEIKPSILGVGPDRFACCGNKFNGNPLPEFCAISWNLLDCFATAVISAPDLQFSAVPLLVRCRLGEEQRILKLHLVALLTDNENIQPMVMTERCQVWIGSYLRPLAKAKGIELGNIHWDRSGPHLFFSVEYPGKMVRRKVAGLGESGPGGKACWPECELALGAISSSMRLRAKQSVDLISTDLEGYVQ